MKSFFIVTIEARRYLNDLVSMPVDGIAYYDCSGVNFKKASVSGVDLIEKGSAINLSDPMWLSHFDEDTKILSVRVDAVELNFNAILYLTHVINVTNDLDFYFNQDPDNSASREVLYQSRIVAKPTFGQSQENNLNGQLSLSTSTLELNNSDRFFNQFLTVDDSFKDCQVIAWRYLNDAYKKVYKGTVSKVDVDDNIKFSFEDFLNRLDKVLYPNVNYANSIAKDRGDVADAQRLFKLTRVYGRASSFNYKYVSVNDEINIKVLDRDKMPSAYCVDYDAGLSTSVNRNWECGILENRSDLEESYTVNNSFIVGVGSGQFAQAINFTDIDNDNFSIGDTLEIQGARYARVVKVTNSFVYVSPWDVVINSGDNVKINKISALVLYKGGAEHYLHYKKDYNVVVGADDVLKAILVNNFESNYGIDPIDPVSDSLHFKLRNQSGLAEYSHGAQLKKILLTEFDSSELNLTSFDDADLNVELDLCFSVPFVNSEFPTKREVVEKILTSTFGYIYLDSDFKLAYGNFKTSGQVGILTDVEIEKGTVSHSIDYNDIYNNVNFISTDFSGSYLLESLFAKYVHSTDKTKEYTHLCDIVSLNAPIDHFKKIAKVFAQKRIGTQLGLLDQTTSIGDLKSIQASKKLGNNNAVVLSLDDTDRKSTVRLAQLDDAKNKIFLTVDGLFIGDI